MLGRGEKRKISAANSQNGESFPEDNNQAPPAKRAAEAVVGHSQETVANGAISPTEKGTSDEADYEMVKQPTQALNRGEEEASEMRR